MRSSTETKRTITPDDHLRAYAMMTLADQHYARTRELERAVGRLLGIEDDFAGHLSDLLYSREAGNVTLRTFDEALAKHRITVAPDPVEDAALATIACLEGAEEAKNDPIFNDTAAVIRQLLEELTRRKVRP